MPRDLDVCCRVADHISPLLGSLISLVRLALGHNRLTGPVPDSLGNLIHLKVLSIEDNHLSGAIPTFVCRLPELEIFNASNNQLEGEIPTAIGQLSMLKKLDLGNNLLTGEMPTSLCCLRFLNWLRLDSNRLTGPVPAQFGNLVRLVVLNLSYNRLCGPVPDVIGILPGLIAVILRENLFQGLFTLVAEGNTCSRRGGVRTLDLAFNQLNEPFPDMRGLQDLQTLVMNDNRLHGSIGQEFGHVCPNLLKLHLQNNKLAGEVRSLTFLSSHSVNKAIGPLCERARMGKSGGICRLFESRCIICTDASELHLSRVLEIQRVISSVWSIHRTSLPGNIVRIMRVALNGDKLPVTV